MKRLRIAIDHDTMQRLDRLVPGGPRLRSEFVRAAIQRALWEIEERQTRQAYARWPDSATDAVFDPTVWEPRPRRGPSK